MNSKVTLSPIPVISPPPAQGGNHRAYGLDALRGAAILAMVLSAAIPWGTLPAWMYHAQNPPPTHALNTGLPGITWVDLVFPLFLFAMGAAFPLALHRRLAAGKPVGRIAGDILLRGVLLGFFAIFHQHVMPHVVAPSGTRQATFQLFGWSATLESGALLVGIVAFLLMFAIFLPFRKSWKPWMNWTMRIGGWVGAIVLLSVLVYPSESRPDFSLYRSNIILVVLTNMAVFGGLAWLLVRGRTLPLLGLMALLLAARFGSQEPGWVQALWQWTPGIRWAGNELISFNWIYQMRYLQYLLVVIPGTIAGGLVWTWMAEPNAAEDGAHTWPAGRWVAIAAFMFAGSVVILVGLQERWLWQTIVMAAALGVGGYFLFRNGRDSTSRFLGQLFQWGLFWLFLGLVLEPYEGGIKKSPATISYYFVCAGLACFLMVGFIVVIDVLRKKRWLQLLIDNGQNPMIAYVGSGLLIVPLLKLIGVHAVLEKWMPGAGWGTVRGIAYTLLLALMVRFLTRKKLFWRT